MTTDTEELDAPDPASDGATADEATGAGADAPADLAEEPVDFWQRPNVDRYVTPLVLPVMIVFGVIAFVLSMSRIFLSEHGHVPVVVGTVITVVILVGAILLSAAPAMRSASVALMGGGFFLAILFAGWLSLGHAEPKVESVALTSTGPALGELKFDATDALKFVPAAADAQTGIWTITLTDLGSDHTLDFDRQGEMGFPGLHVVKQGEVQSARAFFPEEGDFTFYCAIPGHRAAGMEGSVAVTGDPKTLDEAKAEVGDTGAAPAETPTS